MLQEPLAMFFGNDRETERARLFEIVSAANAAGNVADLTSFCLDTLGTLLPFELAFFVLCENTPPRLALVQPRRVSPELVRDLHTLEMPRDFFSGLDRAEGLVPLITHVQELVRTHVHSDPLIVPLIARQAGIGILVLAGDIPSQTLSPIAVRDNLGEFLTSVGASVGIALRRIQEYERLAAREREMFTFLNQAEDGYWQTDGQGHITSANEAALRTLKRTRQEVLGKRIDELSDADPEGVAAIRERLRREGYVRDFILRVRASDGEVRTIRQTLHADSDARGNIKRIQGIFRDITAQRQTEAALVQSNQDLQQLYELATRLNQPIGRQDALNAGLDLILTMTQSQAIGIVLIHQEEGHYDLVAHKGLEPELIQAYASASFDRAIYQPGFDPETTWNLIEYIVLTRRIMTMSDFLTMPRFDIKPILAFGYQSLLAFPMYHDQQVYGVVMVGSKTRLLNDHDTRVAMGISAQLGLALRNQELVADLQVQLRQMRAIAQTGRAIQYAPVAEEGLPQVVREIRKALDASYVVLHLSRGNQLERVTASDDREERLAFDIAPYEKQILESETPLVVRDLDRDTVDPDQYRILKNLEMRAVIGVRLFANTRTQGLLFVNNASPREWTAAEIQLVEQFAQQVAYALANKRQLDEINRQVRELQSLARVGHLIGSATRPDDALQSVTDEIVHVFPADYVSIHLREAELLTLIAESHETDAPRSLPILPYQYRILEELDTTRVTDRRYDATHPSQTEWLSRFDIVADLGVPLVFGHKALGILYVCYYHPHQWTEPEEQLAQTFAQQIASALTNARLLRESQLQVRELVALSRSANLIATSRSAEHALPQAAQELRRVLNADYAGFHLIEGETLRAVTEPHHRWGNVRYPIQPYHRPVIEHFQKIVVNNRDLDTHGAAHRAALEAFGFAADVGVPLVARGRTLGILFVSQINPRQWQKSEVRLIETYAQQIAGVLDNVRLLEQLEKQVHSLAQLALLNEIAATLPHREALIDLALTAGKDLFNADLVWLALLEGEQFLPVWTSSAKPYSSQPPPFDAFMRKIMDGKIPFVMDPENPYQLEGEYARQQAHDGTRSLLLVPLVTSHQNIGMLGFSFSQPHVFTTEEKQLGHTAANQLAMAFANARFFREQTAQIQDLKRHSEFSLWCGTIHDSKQLEQQAVERICNLLQAKAASIRLVEGDFLTTGASYGYRHPEARDHTIPINAYLKHILVQGKTFTRTDLRTVQDVPAHWLERHLEEGFAGMLLVPMVAENRPMGLLTLFQTDAYEWSAAEIQTAEALTNTLALAISNTRQMEKAALKGNELEAILDSVFSGVFVTNVEGEIVTWSNKAQELTGKSEGEMRGKRWDLEGPTVGEARRPDMLVLEAMADNEMRFSIAPRYWLTPGGRTISLREVATPLHDKRRNVRGAVVAFWDRSLEQEGERAKVDLINEVAHELGNKLALVLVAAQELLNTRLSKKRRAEYKQVLQELMKDVSVFHKRFLAYQNERVHEPIETSVIDLEKVVHECLAPLRAAKTGHRFRVAGRFDYVNADKHRLGVVIGNLLDNAVKYAPARSTITIRAERAPGQLTLSIHNRGKPIPPEVQPRLFQRGERGNSEKPGSGLGLWLVQTKLHEMGGEIRFESSAREGTTFFILLKRNVQTPPIPGSNESSQGGGVSAGGAQA